MLVLQKSRDNKNLDQATKHWWVLAWLQPCSDHLYVYTPAAICILVVAILCSPANLVA